MSSSNPDETIYTTDSKKQVKKKIGRAFTGGKVSADEQRELGGNPEVCAVYKYSYFLFEEDDRKLDEIATRCRNGDILCGECKKVLTEKINTFLEKHQERREKAKDIIHTMTLGDYGWSSGR